MINFLKFEKTKKKKTTTTTKKTNRRIKPNSKEIFKKSPNCKPRTAM